MICQETVVLLLIVTLLIITLFIMYMRKTTTPAVVTTTTTVEGFDGLSLDDLLSQYEQLNNEQKNKLAQIIGSPVNQDDMIHKSAIPPQRECPENKFDESEYVKRSSIPPCPEPKPCIAPRVVVDADLCRQQDCPPCPPVQECSNVIERQVPVFVTRTIKLDADGNEVSTTVEQSDVELVDTLLETPPTTTASETTVDNPTTTEGEEPDGDGDSVWSRLFGL